MYVCMYVCMYLCINMYVPVCFYMLCNCSKYVVIVFIKTKIKAWLKMFIKRAGYLACHLDVWWHDTHYLHLAFNWTAA